MFSMNHDVLILLGIVIICFLLIQSVYSVPNSFSIFSLSVNNNYPFSKIVSHDEIIQEISAENGIKNGNNIKVNISGDSTSRDFTIGLWTPTNASYVLQHLKGEEQEKAIDSLLNKGYREYYYVMNNFEDPRYLKMTENLLETANKTNLKIIIILLPPSEGGSDSSYDWRGWIKYFNSLEKKYPRSFEGFTIDDFNWISTRDYTKFKNNVDFMEYSKLSQILKDKSKEVKFYPTVYFEGRKTGIVVKKYDNYIDGLVVATGCYYNVSTLERQLQIFSEIFKKPIRYVVYPTITYNYSKLDYSPPTDRLIMATLSIASNSSNGLIIWRDLDNPVIQEHMENRHDKQYLFQIYNAKEKQIGDENSGRTTELSGLKNVYNTCNSWSKKYNEAYDEWIKAQSTLQRDDWEKKILY
jgi:hypothetical protein